MEEKCIILFAPEGPNISAEGIVTLKFVNVLRKHQWKVIWIYHSSGSWYGKNDIVDENLIPIKNTILFKLSEYLGKAVGLQRYVRYIDSLLWCYKAYKKALKINKEYSVICTFSRVMPVYGHIPALLFKIKTNIFWIANWSDPIPRNKAPYPYGKGINAPISGFNRFYLKKICKHVDAHTFPSDYLCNHYLHYLPAQKWRCYTIPHIIDKDIAPLNNRSIDNTLIISHVGGGLVERNPVLFFKSLKYVLECPQYKDINIIVNFVGPIEQFVIDCVEELSLSDIVKFQGRVSYNESLNYIEQSNVILIIEAPMEEGIFLPSKITDILSFHKPIFTVSPPKGVLKDLISDYHGGIAVNCLSQDSIENGLMQLFDDWFDNKFQSNIYNTDDLFNLFSEKIVYEQINQLINLIK